MMSEHNEATPKVKFFPSALAFLILFLLGLFPLPLIFPDAVLPAIQGNVLNFFLNPSNFASPVQATKLRPSL